MKLLDLILGGLSDQNIRFEALARLSRELGFSERVKGNHHIFFQQGIREIVNIQPRRDGKAKVYQVKQIRTIIHKYQLHRRQRDV